MASTITASYRRWIRPLVVALRELGGSASRPEATKRVIENEGVSEEELALTRGKNGQRKIQNDIDWARNTLAANGVIDRTKPGRWALTEYGIELELTDEIIDSMIRNEREANRKAREDREHRESVQQTNSLGDAGVETVRYWLYAPGENASMWKAYYERGIMGIGWSELGNLKAYRSKSDIRTRLQEINDNDSYYFNAVQITWQFANDVKPGDIVFAKRGRTEILGRGVVTGDYEYDEEEGRYPNVRSIQWTHAGHWTTDNKFATKTLTEVTDFTDFVTQVSALFEEEDDDIVVTDRPASYTAYDKNRFLEEAFMDESTYDELAGVLGYKKNVILQGAPGVGKTFVAKRLAYSVMGVKDPERVMMVQFHQSYSYEDFIEGVRPNAAGEWAPVKGSFYTFCKKAQDDADNEYFFIIDEINRGNLSKIFGELFMLIENDKRGLKYKLQLLYSHELFYVPENVYIIGMMNTADRSLAMLDYALRRRFAFFNLKPGFATDRFNTYRNGLGSAKLNALIACVVRLNDYFAKDETLGEGFCIGHSYFCNLTAETVTDTRLNALVEYEIVPMLTEYWFDEPSKVYEWSCRLREALK